MVHTVHTVHALHTMYTNEKEKAVNHTNICLRVNRKRNKDFIKSISLLSPSLTFLFFLFFFITFQECRKSKRLIFTIIKYILHAYRALINCRLLSLG